MNRTLKSNRKMHNCNKQFQHLSQIIDETCRQKIGKDLEYLNSTINHFDLPTF